LETLRLRKGDGMIVLLSGKAKYAIEGKELDFVLESGRRLYFFLKEGRYHEFSWSLSQLHSYVMDNGKQVEILRNADIIVPPLDCDPRVIGSILGFQSTP
jgi:hypothetical protein